MDFLLGTVLPWRVTGRRLVIAEVFLELLLVEALDVVIDDIDTIWAIVSFHDSNFDG